MPAQTDPGPLLAREFAFGFNLVALALDRFGARCLTWDGSTIDREFADELGELSAGNFHRLMAGLSVKAHDGFYTSAADFLTIVRTLSGEMPAAGDHGLPDAEDLAWGMTEAMLIEPPEGQSPFAPAVVGLVRDVCDRAGLLDPPDVLKLGGGRPLSGWDDRPDVLAEARRHSAARAAEVVDGVRRRLAALVDQLDGLPVRKKPEVLRAVRARLTRMGTTT